MGTYLAGCAASLDRPNVGFNPLGTTGLHCHPFGFGCYRIDERVAAHEASLRKYLDAGGNLIDTSANYTDGGSERTVGRVLKEYDREKIIVVTKGGYIQGENMALARGRSFPEVVKYGPDLWHCIHPEFLATQVERGRARMELETIDVFLLHNPEYFLTYRAKFGLSESDRAEFYRRVREAFAFLETEVEAGRIRWYGISSNNYPLPLADETHTSIARCLEQARAAASNHHFRVVQFPLNLYESGVALNPSNAGLTPLEFCRANGIGTLANRPLNAFMNHSLIRLADFVKPGTPKPGPAELNALLEPLALHEADLKRRHGVRLLEGIGIAGHLRDLVMQVRSVGMWEQVLGRHVILPIRTWLAQAGEQMEGRSKAFDEWQERFIDLVNPLLGELERFVTAQNQPQSDAVRKKLLAAGYPDATHSLSQAALAVLKSLPGLGCSLVGMRRPEYVADVMSAVDFPTVDGVSILRRFAGNERV